MAMAAYYLKGMSPPQARLNQIFAGALLFVFMVFLSMTLVYIFPGIARFGCPARSITNVGHRFVRTDRH